MDTNRLRLCVLAGRECRSTRSALRYLANCNFSTSGVESLADDFDVRKGPVSSRVALLLRSAEGKPSIRLDFPTRILPVVLKGAVWCWRVWIIGRLTRLTALERVLYSPYPIGTLRPRWTDRYVLRRPLYIRRIKKGYTMFKVKGICY